jgi:hypothetical protein
LGEDAAFGAVEKPGLDQGSAKAIERGNNRGRKLFPINGKCQSAQIGARIGRDEWGVLLRNAVGKPRQPGSSPLMNSRMKMKRSGSPRHAAVSGSAGALPTRP